MPLDARLLEILCCPSCREAVVQLSDDQGVACTGCGRSYPIVDGIPVMLIEEAELPAR